MRTIGVREFRVRLADCVRAVADGTEEYEIARHGRVLARLTGPQRTIRAHARSSDTYGQQGIASPTAPSTELQVRGIAVEVERLVIDKLRELRKACRASLLNDFRETSGMNAPEGLDDEVLCTAIARLYQNQLWIERSGYIPAKIALNDLRFWLNLLRASEARLGGL